MLVKEIALEERPRERIVGSGVGVLSNAELIAVILGSGSFSESVISLSSRLVVDGLEGLEGLSLKELMKVKGVGVAKACQVLALFEISRRFKVSKVSGKVIKCAKDVYDYCSPFMSSLMKEEFWVLHLDTRNVVVKKEVISVGTLNSSLVHPREVFRSAVRDGVNSLVLVHNHPSGDVSPSAEDKEVTSVLMKVGEMLGLKVLDHVIVGKDGWFSFKD